MTKKPTTRKGKQRGGRPTKYKPEYDQQAYKLCLMGATDAQLADFFEVDEGTINRWKDKHGGFCASVKRGKMPADGEVAESLFRRATGYTHPDVHIGMYEGEAVITKITKHYPPDTAAICFWLKNRAGWRDKHELEHGVTDALSDLMKELDGSRHYPGASEPDEGQSA